MSGIPRKRLEKAKKDLASIAERHAGPFLNQNIDWQLIRRQLDSLKVALEEGDQGSFDRALQMLIPRLAPPNPLRGKIHSYDNSPKMPARDFDLLNHIVEQLHNDLQKTSTEQSREQADESTTEESDS